MKLLILTFVALAAAQNCPPAPPPLECGPEELMCPGKPMGPEGCMGPGSCQHQSKDANGMSKAKINIQMYKKIFLTYFEERFQFQYFLFKKFEFSRQKSTFCPKQQYIFN